MHKYRASYIDSSFGIMLTMHYVCKAKHLLMEGRSSSPQAGRHPYYQLDTEWTPMIDDNNYLTHLFL